MEAKNPINKKKLSIGIVLIIVLSLLIVLIEKGLYMLAKLILYYGPLALIMVICLHLLVIRYIVLQVAFAGRCILFARPVQHFSGMLQAKDLNNCLDNLTRSLKQFSSLNNNSCESFEYTTIQKSIENLMKKINEYIEVFQRMLTKFHFLTKNQNTLFQNLVALRDNVTDSKICDFLQQKTQENGVIDNSDMYFTNSINKIMLNISNITTILDDFTNKGRGIHSLVRIKTILYNDLFLSLNQAKIELEDYFDLDEYTLKTKDNNLINYIIIKSQPSDNNTRATSLMIICGPNGAPFEFFSKNISLGKYISRGVDVLCWNYRGYGYSTGKATFDNLRSDIIELYEQVKKTGIYTKIGVHGISIGGIPSCYLANNKKIDLLISDRNFASLDLIANALQFGNILYYTYKLLVFPSSSTINDYFDAKCYKVILNDPKDTIVRESASIKTVASRYIINNYLYLQSNHQMSTQLELLDTRIIANSQNENEKSDLDGLDLLLESKSKKELFMTKIIEISKGLNDGQLDGKKEPNCFMKLYYKMKCNKKEFYSNLKEEELQNTSGVFDFIKNKLTDFFKSFESAGDKLHTVVKIKGTRLQKLFLKNFFNNFIVWGTEYYNEKTNTSFFSANNTVKYIEEGIEYLQNFLSAPEIQNFKNLPIIVNVKTLVDLFKLINTNLKNIAVKKGNISLALDNHLIQSNISINNSNEQLEESYESNLLKIGRGNLIGLNCGHNGALNSVEERTLIYHIENSGFVSIPNNNII